MSNRSEVSKIKSGTYLSETQYYKVIGKNLTSVEADKSKSTADWDSRLRQVDHRTLNWLIYKNKKYVVK